MARWLRWFGVMTVAGLLAAMLAAPSSAAVSRRVSLAVPSAATTGGVITARGNLSRSPRGSRVVLQRKVGRSWIAVATSRTRTGAGAYASSFRVPTGGGTYYYRAFAPKTSRARAAASAVRPVVVSAPVPPTPAATPPAPPTPDPGPPAPPAPRPDGITGFQAVPHTPGTGVDLYWTAVPGTDPNMPSDPDNNQSLVIRRSPGTSVPATPTSGTAIATLSATNLTFEDTSELTPGATYSYSIFLRDLDGYFSNPSSVSVIAPNPPVGVNWGSATVPVPYTDGVRDLECPTADFCMLIGGAAYQTWSGGEWSEPVALPDPFDISSTVSCGSADLCMITRGRQFSVFNGQAWSPADVVSQSIPDDYRFEYMECAASSCLATTSYNYSLRWNGASWNIAPKSSNDLNFGDSVHCAADNLCFSGNAEWNGTQWIGSGSPGFGVDGMSCASTTFCVWVGLTRGDMTRYNGQGWASMASPWNSQGLQYVDVACTAPTFCISVAQTGDYPVGTQFSTFDGASWSAPANLDPAFGTRAQVECLSSARCFVAAISATHGDVHLSSYENGSWSAPVTVTHGNHLAGVSCIPNGVCVSSDFAGNIRTSAGSTWSAPTLVDPASGVKSLSCGSATFCAVVDDGGGAVVKANGIWGSRQVLTSGVALDFLSCTSDQACMAMSSSGVAVQYQNGQWTDVSSPTYFPGPVACGSMNYCVGDGYWWNGSVWQQMPGTQGRYGFSATCLTPTDCLVSYGAYSSGKPTAAHFVNGAWSGAPYPIGRSTYYNHGVRVDSISCFAADRCAAVGSDGLVTFSSGGVTVGPPVPVWRGGGSGVSCSSATLCVAFVGEYVWISH